ncbi:lipid-A-disaccharide synthase [Tranquillimonas alkanivorans]|uniref:Lipid-A-disaccharide synthase n=1 Tax=Tranquillimonas alkanivorans TaxID=441119 RepID=A0A1I5NW72_9RHOB|nr:lipid-A-disaccharide synthase [Tranquillimonas alkanivorans]
MLAGEPSGDRLGGALMTGLRTLSPDVEFAGIGGVEMRAQGLESLFPMDELSVMGIAEVLPRYRHLLRRMHQTADAVLEWQPDVLITIDVPDFALRVAREVKARSDIRTVHYVAPSVWAWRPGRAAKMARSIDQVLALLPFEPPYMEAAGMRCDFVGHPVVSEPVASDAEAAAFRTDTGIGDAPMILVLPGSRRNEVARLAPIFGEALRPVLARHASARVVVPAAAPVAATVAEQVKRWPGAPLVLDPSDLPRAQAAERKRRAFAAADVALAASGTVSLELAAVRTPMVVAYDMNWISWQIISRMVRVDSATLVNLVTDSKAVPEFLGPACRPQPIADALDRTLEAPGKQLAALDATMEALGRGGEAPGLRAARAVLDGLA